MPYHILVSDNFHFGDEDEDVTIGPFESADSALAKARTIIDEFLSDELKSHVSAAALLAQWVQFGETPIIVGDDPKAAPVDFSAPSYAKQRCAQMMSGE